MSSIGGSSSGAAGKGKEKVIAGSPPPVTEMERFEPECSRDSDGGDIPEGEPNPQLDWSPCILRKGQIEELIRHGFLPKNSNWRCPERELFPTEDTHQIVVFKSFYEVGFGLPASDFFRRLLHYYGVELQHLNTNSILQIAIFVHLCEAYLGIDPHFQLFRYLFRMKVTSATHSRCVGRAGLQLRQGMKDL
ncbi:MAG TPA: hypothetical protein VFK94_02870, partial [Patescibacteria group bacterium]|nr:hypothetical protein [Patescibacteria group bacterium]